MYLYVSVCTYTYIHTKVSGQGYTMSLLVIINSQVGLSYFTFLFKNRNNSTYSHWLAIRITDCELSWKCSYTMRAHILFGYENSSGLYISLNSQDRTTF